MKKIVLDTREFRKKVYGCWLGKAIGGTLGMPHEGKPGPLALTFYDPVPTTPVPNDDLDLQVMWLALMQQYGPGMNRIQMGRGWRDYADFPWDEYGVASCNLGRGIFAPASGHHGNLCGDCMGSPIRSELWATLAAGDPELAAQLAYNDAIQDHDGEGIWGEVFFAVVESAAYVMSDRESLIRLGLSAIPSTSKTHQAVRSTLEWYEQSRDWKNVREKILARFGHENFTDAPQNIAITMLGWIHGKDFGDCLCTAVNCGQDADCTGATLGSILGILDPQAIPEKWKKPISKTLKISAAIKNIDVPTTLDDLTDMTVEMARRMHDERSNTVTISTKPLPRNTKSSAEKVSFSPLSPLTHKEKNEIILSEGDVEISAIYPDGLDFVSGKKLGLKLQFTNKAKSTFSARLNLELPFAWKIDQMPGSITLKPNITKILPLSIVPSKRTRIHTAFALLSLEKEGVRSELKIPFISKWPWKVKVNDSAEKIVWLPERTIPISSHFNFPAGTRINLSSNFHLSRKQLMRIVLGYRGAGSLSIDGEKIIEYTRGYFLPFPHRTPPEIYKDVLMTEGSHCVDVELVIDDNRSNAAVVFADAYSYHIIYDLTFQPFPNAKK